MELKNLFDCCDPGAPGETSQAFCVIHDSPQMKVLNVKLFKGQHLLLYSDRMQGSLSLVAMEGHGELVDLEDGKFPLKTGDIVISQTDEPHSLTAGTDLRLLLTIIAPATTSAS
jgi:quercetin dioxygenase-like cupin family protein